MPSQITYDAPTTFTTAYAAELAVTTAASPTAIRTTWTMIPMPLPATERSASRRPTVRARPMVNSRLGPGTWMKRVDATRNASHWLVVGTQRLSTLAGPLARRYPAPLDPAPDHQEVVVL